jgi:phosphoenolpyruvate carboxykinase (ATP)
MKLRYTRAMVRAALSGALDDVPTRPDPFFGIGVPERVPDVPDEILHPRATWSDAAEYDRKAAELAAMFRKNFERYAEGSSPEVIQAGPRG